MEVFANRFESEQQLHEWLITFYEKQLIKFINNIGGKTSYGVKITPAVVKSTIRRYSQLLEKYDVIDWEQS